MNGILIIPSSPNGDTIENILRIVFDQQSIVDNSLPCVDKVTFLESGNLTGMKLHGTSYSLASGYEEIFLRLNLAHIECRRRKINKYAEEIPSIIMSAIREVGRENIILDLTSGKKDITGSLYTAATICNISNMIYVEVLRSVDNCFYILANEDSIQSKYILTKFQSLDALENLASQNCMEFVIYKKYVSQINEGRTSQLLELFCSHLNNAIDYYFNGSSIALMQSIRNIGSINEQLIGLISRALCSKFNHLASNNIPSGVFGPISYYEDLYTKLSGKKNRSPDDEQKLHELATVYKFVPTLYHLLESIKRYRNQVSHEIQPHITKDDAKLVIDMMLKILSGLCSSSLATELFEND